MKIKSKISLYFCFLIVLITSFLYYPKWQQTNTEATISWDVSGYYWYLPAVFIYEDVIEQKWKNDIHKKYHPDAGQNQSYEYRPNVLVNKYSCGMSVQYLPAFAAAHLYAKSSKYPADGFSKPYQLSIQIWSVLFCLMGLLLLRKVLLLYFDDFTTMVTLLLLVLGTNYLNTAAIDGAMTHNYLFTWYAALILLSHRFYKKPSYTIALLIGLTVGVAALTRPTELIAILIPLGYGMHLTNKESWQNRTKTVKLHFPKYVLATLTVLAVGFLQLLYWKYVTGEWLVYSYEDQGFSWLSPHFINYNWSYASGWLTYSPLMLFSLLGTWWLFFRRPKLQIFSVFALLFWYVTCAWDFWNFGGRAMVQSYPILMIGLAYLISRVSKSKDWKKVIFTVLSLLFIAYNLWWTHGIHKGGYTSAYNNTKSYFWRTLGRTNIPPEVQKLKDTKYIFEGTSSHLDTLAVNSFSDLQDTLYSDWGFSDGHYDYVNSHKQYSQKVEVLLPTYEYDWYRVSAIIGTQQKEYGTWKQTRLILQGFKDDEANSYYAIRLDRLSEGPQNGKQWIDVPVRALRRKGVNRVVGLVQHSGSTRPTLIDDLAIIGFNED